MVHAEALPALRRLLALGRIVQNRLETRLPQGLTGRIRDLIEAWEQGDAMSLPRMTQLVRALRDGGRAELSAARKLLLDTSKWAGLKLAIRWFELLADRP